jgi:hypothetical protein
MARFVRISLCALFIASALVPLQLGAQTHLPKAPAQKGTKQAKSGTTKTQPATAPAQPKGEQPQPAAPQTQPANAQNQPAANQAPAPQAGGQAQPQNAQPLKITGVNVFQTAPTPDGNASFYLEISGQSLTTASPAVFLAPQKGVTGTLDVVSAKDSQIVVKFTASKDYFPSTVGVVGTGGANSTFDLTEKRLRIDDVEVLQLDRKLGTGSIKIGGANFGNEPNKITVAIVPSYPGLPAFAPPDPAPDPDSAPDPYTCVSPKPAQRAKPPKVDTDTANNDVVVVHFSFPCTVGYSAPFRIARVVLSVKGDKGEPSSSASYEMVPGRDKNLTYRSTILSQKQTASRFGGGIAKNFYAVQLSIVNQGSVKVQVPLASIQAEVEWLAGAQDKKFYREGPATVAPVPLTGAISYFSTHRQSTGARAKVFNYLQGLTTIGSAVQLFFGHGFAQGVAIAGGGFRQGLGQILPDLSDQQLANLTSQSFESIETVSGNGGSIEKVIFIQRGEEVLESGRGENESTNADDKSTKKDGKSTKGEGEHTKFSRLIDNILGFEIPGYEVPETSAKSATRQP